MSGARRLGACLAAALLTALAAPASAEPPPRRTEASIGYAYPAGGRRGDVVRVAVGGQALRTTDTVLVSGAGVSGRVVRWLPPFSPLDAETAKTLRRRLDELVARRTAEREGRRPPEGTTVAPDGEGAAAPLPKHPLLEGLDDMGLEDLARVRAWFFRRRTEQTKRSIAETVEVELTIRADAALGIRDLRLVTASGVTNPLRFEVGWLREIVPPTAGDPEREDDAPITLPAVLNGQVMAHEVDRFRIEARAGSRLVVRTRARALIPYMADAVPGWMQAVVAIRDEEGRELAFADEWRFDPDPVLVFDVPEDGVYQLEVRDAIYRGREDFVYRVEVGAVPFVTSIFPLGGTEGVPTVAEMHGENLGGDRLALDTRPGPDTRRQAAWTDGTTASNVLPYEVDPWPAVAEREPNDTADRAFPLAPPRIVDGRIDPPGDVDEVRFEGRAGQEIVAEVQARALGSPLDAVLHLIAPDGEVVAWSDDHPDPSLGLMTHPADPYLRARLPRAGIYRVRLTDAQRQGGEAWAYRLRVGPPRPDVTVLVTPSSVELPAGGAALLTVHVVRRDGYDGEVELELAGGARGFALAGATVPPGHDVERITLTADAAALAGLAPLALTARIRVGGREVERPVIPADDVMQAFLWRHLVPAQELVALVRGGGRTAARLSRTDDGLVRIPVGRRARLRYEVEGRLAPRDVRLALVDPPDGVSLERVTVRSGQVHVEVRADRAGSRVGAAGTLILQAWAEIPVPPAAGEATGGVRSVPLGLLPAVPFEIVR